MKKTIISLVVVALAVLFAGVANAQVGIPPGVPITLGEVGDRIVYIANFLIGVSVLIVVIAIIWAGITYMTAGSNDAKVALARRRFLAAVIGALIIFGIGVIMRTVQLIIQNRNAFFN